MTPTHTDAGPRTQRILPSLEDQILEARMKRRSRIVARSQLAGAAVVATGIALWVATSFGGVDEPTPHPAPCGETGAVCPVGDEPVSRPVHQQNPRPQQPRQVCRTVKVPYGHGYDNAYTFESRCEWVSY